MAKFSTIVPVMTLGSISKGWTVPGWRTGWVALHDLDGVFKCTKVVTAAKEFLGITSKPPTVIQAAIPAILKHIPKEFFDNRQRILKDNADYAYSRVSDIATLKCFMKPEACTFIWTKLDLDAFIDIKNDLDFCEKLAAKENLVLLPGIAFGLSGWARHSIDMDSSTLEDAFDRLESFCDYHSTPPYETAHSTTDEN
ncbi:putative aminotransferase TAT4 [Raphanus sativus]|nr:putative aminotransferase TAT4 [Raphanus sativus]